jgi:hypothetical protein
MDPMIRIYRASGSEIVRIALNYDNGLKGTGDSFLQMALPADDQYYIVVNNYYTDYGSDYIYRLHVKLQ